ncbi:hypothetical protein BV882_38265 [Streptomyces sp. 46]|nr:hypothetical protein BV882_38265 [Streptomyces sp. 46]
MVLVYVSILPSVITALWVLAWRGAQPLRWGALSGGAVVSVLCVVIGINTNGPPVAPSPGACRPALACFDPDPVFWMVAGLLGFACCFVLTVVTVAVELRRTRRASD